MVSDNIYPGMLIRNRQGDIGWVVSQMPNPYLFLVEWSYGDSYPKSAQNVLEDHQRLLDFQRQHGL